MRIAVILLFSLLLVLPADAATATKKAAKPAQEIKKEQKIVTATARAEKSKKAKLTKAAKETYAAALKTANDEFIASVRQSFEGYNLALAQEKKAESKEDIQAARDVFLCVIQSAGEAYSAAKTAAKEAFEQAKNGVPPSIQTTPVVSTSTDVALPTAQ